MALLALVGADARPQALLARAPFAVMLAYTRSTAFLALALLALVGADARPQALLALASFAVMLAYLRSPAFLAPALDALVGADARPQALLARAPFTFFPLATSPKAQVCLPNVEGADKIYCIRQRPRKGCLRVGRDDESTSSLRPELAAIERVLQTTELTEDLLILSDCKTALTEILKWIGEGLRPCMAVTKDADILKAVVERLCQRNESGVATWLVKIKAHREEPLNE